MIQMERDGKGIRRCINCYDVETVTIQDIHKHLADYHGWLIDTWLNDPMSQMQDFWDMVEK